MKSPEFQSTGRWLQSLVNQINSPVPSVSDHHTLRSTPSANHTVNNWTGRNVQTFHRNLLREILAMPWWHIPVNNSWLSTRQQLQHSWIFLGTWNTAFVNWQNEPWLLYHREITGILICACQPGREYTLDYCLRSPLDWTVKTSHNDRHLTAVGWDHCHNNRKCPTS